MNDPLTEVIRLLRPRAVFTKPISGRGRWAVRYSRFDQPSFAAVLEGACHLEVEGQRPVTLSAGDFVLLPATPAFTMSGFEPTSPVHFDPKRMSPPLGEVRHGTRGGRPDVRLLGGYFTFDSPDQPLLVSLLPVMFHVRGAARLTTLVQLVAEETRAQRAGRELVLSHLIEILLIEALRTEAERDAPAGLLRGLSDARLAPALRNMHAQPGRAWTVRELAKTAGLSRSMFFERFSAAIGVSPMEYLLAWRMALAKDLLERHEGDIAAVAEHVGYASSSTFSTAFARHVGTTPGRYARGSHASGRPLPSST